MKTWTAAFLLAVIVLLAAPVLADSQTPSALSETPAQEVRTAMPTIPDAPPRKVVVGTMVYAMWETYPGLDSRLNTLAGFVDRMAAEAQRKYRTGLDLAILPECAITGETYGDPPKHSFPLEGKVLEAMGAVARKHHTYLIVPLNLCEDAPRGIYSNAAVLLDREGRLVGIYRKVHAVADYQGETLEGGLIAGRDFPVFQCDFGKVGIQICFDMTFDDGWEGLARKGAEIVAWPSQSPQTIEPRGRARRHSLYIVSSTWRNNASVFDPVGDLIAQTTEPSSVLVEQIDLSYALIDWQPTLENGKLLADKYGKAVGYRYSEAEDGGIFWSNDPKIPVLQMVRELGLELRADALARQRKVQDKVRGGPPSLD
jgi:predicted amidohydrolase